MKKRLLLAALFYVLVWLMMLIFNIIVFAAEPDTTTPTPSENIQEVRVTCYTATGNPCANGKYPEEGIVAYCPEYVDNAIVRMWASEDGAPGEYIGDFEVWDTGNPNIQEGRVVDVYRDNLDRCTEFMAQFEPKVFIEVIEKETAYDTGSRLREDGNTTDNSSGCVRDGDVREGEVCSNTQERIWSFRQLDYIRSQSLYGYGYFDCTEALPCSYGGGESCWRERIGTQGRGFGATDITEVRAVVWYRCTQTRRYVPADQASPTYREFRWHN